MARHAQKVAAIDVWQLAEEDGGGWYANATLHNWTAATHDLGPAEQEHTTETMPTALRAEAAARLHVASAWPLVSRIVDLTPDPAG